MEKQEKIPFSPESRVSPEDKFKKPTEDEKPVNYTRKRKVFCHWTDKKKYWIPYRMFKLFVKHGMIVMKTHEIISSRQNKWLENYIHFGTMKRSKRLL